MLTLNLTDVIYLGTNKKGLFRVPEILAKHFSKYFVLLLSPRLQLVARLLSQYPESVPEEELQPLLSTLQELFAESKKIEVTCWLVQCLVAMVRVLQHSESRITEFTAEICRDIWQRVWLAAFR